MTKEELELEAEEWVKKDCCNDCCAQDCKVWCREVKHKYRAYLVSAEPREKRIAELEKENKVLAQNLEDTEICEKALKDKVAELKESFFVVRCVRSGCPYLHLETRNCLKVGGFFTAVSNKHCPMMQNLNSSIQLTKATEIIKKLKALYLSPVVTKDDVKRQDEILAEAEQFLKDCEVEK
jgi:hypothetical protein